VADTDPSDTRTSSASDGPSRRRWLLGLLLVVATYAVGLGVVGVRDAADALRTARWLPLLGAGALEAVTVATLAMVHKVSARAVGGHVRYPQALNVSMSMFTLSHTLPGGGAVGGAVAMQRLRAYGLDGPSAAASVALTGILAMATITGLAAGGVTVAVIDEDLPWRALLAALGLLVVLLGAAVGIVALLRSPRAQRRVLRRVGAIHERLRERVGGWSSSLRSLRQDPPSARDLAPIVGWSTLNWSGDIAALWLVFVAVGEPVTVSTLLIGFGVSQVGAAIPFTPGGVGFVESGMVGAFVVLGVPASEATTIVLAYRVLATWLPALAGLFPLLRPPDGDEPTGG
jgi:uncharacterized protein (TIRG00374 family)